MIFNTIEEFDNLVAKRLFQYIKKNIKEQNQKKQTKKFFNTYLNNKDNFCLYDLEETNGFVLCEVIEECDLENEGIFKIYFDLEYLTDPDEFEFDDDFVKGCNFVINFFKKKRIKIIELEEILQKNNLKSKIKGFNNGKVD